MTRKRNSSGSQDDDEYRKKRDRNNEAVKRCRIKLNEQAKKIKCQTDELMNENRKLKGKIEEKEVHIRSVVDLIMQKNPTPEVRDKVEKIMKPIEKYSESTSKS